MINDLQLDTLAIIAEYQLQGYTPTRRAISQRLFEVRGDRLAYSTVNTTLQRLVALKAIKMGRFGRRAIYALDDPDLMLAKDYSTLYRTTELVRQWKEMNNGNSTEADSSNIG